MHLQEMYRWGRCTAALPAAAMRSIGSPLPEEHLADLQQPLTWSDFQVWSAAACAGPAVGNEPKYCHCKASAFRLTTPSSLHAVGSNRGARQKGVLCAGALAICAAAAAKGSTCCSSSRTLTRSRAECRC